MRRVLVAAAVLAAFGCNKGSSPAAKKNGPVVAQGGGISVTAEEFKARLDEQSPMIRASFNSLDRKKQFLDNMLRFELLAAAAEKEGLANDPDVQFTMKKVMVSKYYQKFFQADADPTKTVPDEESRKYFDEHPEEFRRPARVHTAHVFLKAEQGSPDRAKKAAEAKKLLAKILADEKKNPSAFTIAARESSEDAATKPLGGDLAQKSQAELEAAWGKELAEVAFKLQDNQTASTVVETPKGFHLVRVLGRQAEVNRAYDDVKAQIAAKLASSKKTKAFDDYVKKLREDAKIAVNDAELEKVQLASAPAGGMGGMGGMMGGAPHGAQVMPAPAPGRPAPAAAPH
jgi:peptidyl-prolyl cis-trans isomerase C